MKLKKTILLFVLLLGTTQCFPQKTSKDEVMEVLKAICQSLRDGLEKGEGCNDIISEATRKYVRFTDEYMFTDDFAPLHKKTIKGENDILGYGNDEHVVYIPNYFIELLKEDSVSTTGEKLLEEWTCYINENSSNLTKGASKTIFRHSHFIIRKGKSVTFELTVPKGKFEILVVSEPYTYLAMRVLEKSTGENHPSVNSKVAHKSFTFKESTVLEVTIENVSFKNASMALFCL